MSTSTHRFLHEEDGVSRHVAGMTVLVVDDYQWICDLIAMGLEGLGFHALTASNGTEAWEVVTMHGAGNINLLITEVEITGTGGRELTGMGGKELAEWFLRENPQGRVIMMSAFPHELNLEERIVVLRKPFGHEELITKIDEMFAMAGTP